MTTTTGTTAPDPIHDEVRERYARAALSVIDPTSGSSEALDSSRRADASTCCGSDCCGGSAEDLICSVDLKCQWKKFRRTGSG